jgi:hypothetical protein
MKKLENHWIRRRASHNPDIPVWIYLPSHRGVAASILLRGRYQIADSSGYQSTWRAGPTSEVYLDSIYISYVRRCNVNIIVQLAPGIQVQIGNSRNAGTGWQ